MQGTHLISQDARDDALIWKQQEFLQVAALQQLDNHLRRASEIVQRLRIARPEDGRLEENLSILREQRAEHRARITSHGVPDLPMALHVATDAEREHRLSINAGVAMCALPIAVLQDIRRLNTPRQLRIEEVTEIVRSCARLGWDKEISDLLTRLRPAGQAGTLPERIGREPWSVTDYPEGWRYAVDQCLRFRERAAGEPQALAEAVAIYADGPHGADPAASANRIISRLRGG